jgi:hypothetical protein
MVEVAVRASCSVVWWTANKSEVRAGAPCIMHAFASSSSFFFKRETGAEHPTISAFIHRWRITKRPLRNKGIQLWP